MRLYIFIKNTVNCLICRMIYNKSCVAKVDYGGSAALKSEDDQCVANLLVVEEWIEM